MPISDYTFDNLLKHLKALRALGLWDMKWENIATLLGTPGEAEEGFSPTIYEIDEILIEKMLLAVGLTLEAGWKELIYVLGLKKNASLGDAIDALYERKHEEEFKKGAEK